MGFSKPPGVPCPGSNPHCPDYEPIATSIQSDLFTFLIVAGILYYMLIIFKLIKPFSFSFKRNNNWESNKL